MLFRVFGGDVDFASDFFGIVVVVIVVVVMVFVSLIVVVVFFVYVIVVDIVFVIILVVFVSGLDACGYGFIYVLFFSNVNFFHFCGLK